MEYRLLIEGSGAAPDGPAELAEWLRHERELRGRFRLEQGEIRGDDMGGLPEALVVALSTGGAATVLARAVVEWVRHRTRDVSLKVTRPSGETFEVDVQRAGASDALVTELLDFLRQGERQGTDSDETA
ncbi:hypothetical protein [Streptomyces sp. SID13726]|uniref:effector-associated constant component EACC1 n=1 Tax=Streptomyces sp. SID13726 TaxID=2706058 RepID=UPI0013B7EDFD|nr:hypothetical protein [Streptomyces sp. SID13726]